MEIGKLKGKDKISVNATVGCVKPPHSLVRAIRESPLPFPHSSSLMLEEIAAALDRQDYKTAAQLLKQLQQTSPDSLWVKLYAGRLQEASGKKAAAAAAYRQVLQGTTNPKLVNQAREGLQRLKSAKSMSEPAPVANTANSGTGFLVLEPIAPEARQSVAQSFAQVMKLDAYTARLLLPSRGWKLYRVGTLSEMQGYTQALRRVGMPVFCVSLAAVQKIRVFRVQSFEAASPQVKVICQNEADELGALSFHWSEVANRVAGSLPIFEDVVDLGAFNKLKRKEQTQDFAQMMDLHLPKRGCILRLCDRSYQFDQGVVFDASQDGAISASQTTTRIHWNKMLAFLDDRLTAVPLWSDFSVFADSALEHLDFVTSLTPHIDILRKAPSNWDSAFHLYSGLVYEYPRRVLRT